MSDFEADVKLRSELEAFRSDFLRLRQEVSKVIVGHLEILDDTLIALIGGGHVLLEGVPGLGKTQMVRTLADALALKFQRIQFTPDLMPADLIGTNVFLEMPDGRKQFEFQQGPIFGNILLADEINRATPKTQSALLEAMQEHSVTVAGRTHKLSEPFFVMATQNPLEMEGTYPLPEAQLDRFFCKLIVKFPLISELETILDRTTESAKPKATPVLEDGELKYEFFHEPGKFDVHPALGRLAFLLSSEGMRTHWTTDGAYERSGLAPDNAEPLPGAPPVPLKRGDWNHLQLKLSGSEIQISVNGTKVAAQPLPLNNQRTFGLFRFADMSGARVRNVLYRGKWSQSLPALEEQELAATAK